MDPQSAGQRILRNDTVINVAALLQEPIGATRSYDFVINSFPLDDDLFARDLTGTLRLTRVSDALLAATPRGIVALNFLDPDHSWDSALAELHKSWSAATITQDEGMTAPLADAIFSPQSTELPPLRVLVKGTNFQVKVWEALLRIPPGAVCTYADVARTIQNPAAVRAVGGAVGANAVAYLIPCHRVIRQGGLVSDYRWGATRKRAIIGWEAAHLLQEDEAASA